MQKYNLKEIIKNIKKLNGQEVLVTMAQNNGRQPIRINGNKRNNAGKILTSTWTIYGKLEFVENKDNLCHSRLIIDGTSFPFLGLGNDPVYQCGLAKLISKSPDETVYDNTTIKDFPDCFIHTISDVFDEESVNYIFEKHDEYIASKNSNMQSGS